MICLYDLLYGNEYATAEIKRGATVSTVGIYLTGKHIAQYPIRFGMREIYP